MSTAARNQYLQIKSQYSDAILLYQVGDFYETYDEDAYIASRVLEIVLTQKVYKDERAPMAGIPLRVLDNYVGKLIQAGYKVAICDQVGEVGRGPVDRAVTRILTSGTLSEPNLLPARQHNFLVALAPGRAQTGLAAIDVSTGEFSVTWFAPDALPGALEAELQRLAPSECLLPEAHAATGYKMPSETMTLTPCPAYFFEPEAARARLCKLFGAQSLDAYGCEEAPQAIAAAGAIAAYLEKMNPRLLSLLTGLRSYRTSSFMTLDAHTQRNLELLQGTRRSTSEGSLLSVLDRTLTPMGARLLRLAITQPLLDLSLLEARLDSVEELYESPALRSRFVMCLQRLGDMERIAGRVRQGTAIPREVLALRDFLQVVPQAQTLLRGCNAALLLELADGMDACPQVIDLIDRALTRAGNDEEGENDGRLIRAGFSQELDELMASIRDSRRWIASLETRERERTGIPKLKVGFNSVFGYYIEIGKGKLSMVPADYTRKQTLVSGERFITPELKEHEARILSAEERIEEMERSIYADVLRQLGVSYPQMMATARAIASLDMLLSFAEVAAHQGYTRPRLEHSRVIDITAGRHPVVEHTLDGDTFIPNDTQMDAGQDARILLLTGPNMAGKSTYLRQVALITLLAHIGSFVPARSARIGLVDRIFTRVGAEDDIASGKSTFMVEMEETASILHHATRHSLIILDEIGRGTSTYDGLAIARAVVEHLHNVTQARTLFATHYHELAAMADELPSLRVYMMAISNGEHDEIIFLHHVVAGSAGRSYGVHVAKLAGMPQSVVQRARDVLLGLESARDGLMAEIIGHNGNGHAAHGDLKRMVAEEKGGYSIATLAREQRAAQASPPSIHFAEAEQRAAQAPPPSIHFAEAEQRAAQAPPPSIHPTPAPTTDGQHHVAVAYTWKSEEARLAAQMLEQVERNIANGAVVDGSADAINRALAGADAGGRADAMNRVPTDALLNRIDLSAITPLDALNLLFLMQKKSRSS